MTPQSSHRVFSSLKLIESPKSSAPISAIDKDSTSEQSFFPPGGSSSFQFVDCSSVGDLISRTGAKMSASRDENRLKFACDAGMLSNGSTPNNHDDDCDSEDSNEPTSSGSRTCDSPPTNSLAASLRLFGDSLVRMEQAETEMMRVRETMRCEAEKRRMEMESELTRMMLATELQIASIVAGKGLSRKRKRIEDDEDESTISWRKRALLRCLLHCNFSF